MYLEIIQEMAHWFEDRIDEDFTLTVQVDISDTEESCHIVANHGTVTVCKGPHTHPHITLTTTEDTLQKIYNGEITAFTAAEARMSDNAPLDWNLSENGFSPEIVASAYFFVQHFFTRTTPEKILLDEQYSRLANGGHVIPLYSHPGFRSGWYLVKKGEKLNEPGDTDLFFQAVIFIEGCGFAKIGDKTVAVKKGESYSIPPHKDHVIWTESDQPLILIWLAWGEGA
jgi:mannose-6-phosphate isomerase-like protein (cupin superfamily)